MPKRDRAARLLRVEHLLYQHPAGLRRVSGTVEITPWIRSWGADAEVLEPAELRRRIAGECRRQAELYG